MKDIQSFILKSFRSAWNFFGFPVFVLYETSDCIRLPVGRPPGPDGDLKVPALRALPFSLRPTGLPSSESLEYRRIGGRAGTGGASSGAPPSLPLRNAKDSRLPRLVGVAGIDCVVGGFFVNTIELDL